MPFFRRRGSCPGGVFLLWGEVAPAGGGFVVGAGAVVMEGRASGAGRRTLEKCGGRRLMAGIRRAVMVAAVPPGRIGRPDRAPGARALMGGSGGIRGHRPERYGSTRLDAGRVRSPEPGVPAWCVAGRLGAAASCRPGRAGILPAHEVKALRCGVIDTRLRMERRPRTFGIRRNARIRVGRNVSRGGRERSVGRLPVRAAGSRAVRGSSGGYCRHHLALRGVGWWLESAAWRGRA